MYRKKKNRKDVKYILTHLRKEDKHECLIQRGKNYIKDLTNEIIKSNSYFLLGCSKKDNTPICMGGIAETNEKGVAAIWLLCTDEIVNHQYCLLKNLKEIFDEINKKYWFTYNFIFKENFLAKKWLKKFGYEFIKTDRDDFELFYRKRNIRGLKDNADSTTI